MGRVEPRGETSSPTRESVYNVSHFLRPGTRYVRSKLENRLAGLLAILALWA